MNTLSEFIAVIEFVGKNMTEAQATTLLDQAKDNLSEVDMERLSDYIFSPFYAGPGHLYTSISEYQAECGRF